MMSYGERSWSIVAKVMVVITWINADLSPKVLCGFNLREINKNANKHVFENYTFQIITT